MVGHQHIGMNVTLVLVGGIRQFSQIEPIILICTKYHATIVASLNDMLRVPWQNISRQSRYDFIPLKSRLVVDYRKSIESDPIDSCIMLSFNPRSSGTLAIKSKPASAINSPSDGLAKPIQVSKTSLPFLRNNGINYVADNLLNGKPGMGAAHVCLDPAGSQ
jgi:hypothetical protein